MTKNICSRCGTEDDVKAAIEYAGLVDLLDTWNMFGIQADLMFCPKCALMVSGEMSQDAVKILPLDFLEPDDPDEEP